LLRIAVHFFWMLLIHFTLLTASVGILQVMIFAFDQGWYKR
jgi:hypothetical protein